MTMHPRALAAALALAAATIAAPRAHTEISLPEGFVSETLVEGLDLPNSMAFLPDGRVLVTELKDGSVHLIVNGRFAATDPVLWIGDVNPVGYERGLQGIAVDPDWPARPYIYVYFTRTGGRCALARYTGQGDLSDPAGENLTFGDRLFLIDDITDIFGNHNGGGVRFGIDGRLFVSTGEDEQYCDAADSTTLMGTLLRLDVSRLPATPAVPGVAVPRALITPPDNPFAGPDSNAALVWAWGMRNPWRFHVDPVTGLVYLADVGEEDFEEINEVHRGQYLGWPFREGNLVLPRAFCPEPGGDGAKPYAPPIVAMPHNPSDTAILTAGPYRPRPGATANWPASYWGDVFYSEYHSGVLRRVTKSGSVWASAPPEAGQPDPQNWGTGFYGAVDFLVGPDGSLWWLRSANDDQQIANGTGRLGRIRFLNPDTTDTATEVTLVHGIATPDFVRLEWYVPDSGLAITLERRVAGGAWQALAELRADGTGRVRYEDRAVSRGVSYDYRVAVRDGAGVRHFAETRIVVPARLDLAVHGIRPQPGADRLIVAFTLPVTGAVRLELIDVSGRRALERDLGVLDAGHQLVRLPALDVESGFYVVRITQSGRSATNRAIIAR